MSIPTCKTLSTQTRSRQWIFTYTLLERVCVRALFFFACTLYHRKYCLYITWPIIYWMVYKFVAMHFMIIYLNYEWRTDVLRTMSMCVTLAKSFCVLCDIDIRIYVIWTRKRKQQRKYRSQNKRTSKGENISTIFAWYVCALYGFNQHINNN